MVRFDFPMTKNEAKYEALVAGLDLTKAAGATRVVIHCNSQVATNQVNGEYECKGERMKKYLEQVKKGGVIYRLRLFKSQEKRMSKPTVLPCRVSGTLDPPWQGTFLCSTFTINRYH